MAPKCSAWILTPSLTSPVTSEEVADFQGRRKRRSASSALLAKHSEPRDDLPLQRGARGGTLAWAAAAVGPQGQRGSRCGCGRAGEAPARGRGGLTGPPVSAARGPALTITVAPRRAPNSATYSPRPRTRGSGSPNSELQTRKGLDSGFLTTRLPRNSRCRCTFKVGILGCCFALLCFGIG